MPRTLDPDAAIAPAKLSHVVFRARNYDAMVKWWNELAGGRVSFITPNFAFLTYDDEHHRVALLNLAQLSLGAPPTLASGQASPIDHVSFTYADLGALLSFYKRLKAKGILPHKAINHGTTTSIYYLDPDDNQIELQVDNFATMKEADDFLRSDTFKANPIGVEFDPEIMADLYCAGAPVEDLLKQGSTSVSAMA